MCVAGKNMLPDFRSKNKELEESIEDILDREEQSDVFVSKAVGILSKNEWFQLQVLHDAIASENRTEESITYAVTKSLLFTYPELVEFCETKRD